MSLTVGAWVFPLFISIAAFWVAGSNFPQKSGDYDFVSGFVGLLFMACAAIVALLAWLVWALL